MKLKFSRELDGEWHLHIGENAFIHTWNDWRQLLGGCNWYTFTFAHITLENDVYTGGYEFEFVILGLGFRVRVNNPNSEGFKELEKLLTQFTKPHKYDDKT